MTDSVAASRSRSPQCSPRRSGLTVAVYIVVDSWEAGYRWFPGQVLGSLARGGTVELGMSRAAATAALYAAAAVAISAVSVHRRDVTA